MTLITRIRLTTVTILTLAAVLPLYMSALLSAQSPTTLTPPESSLSSDDLRRVVQRLLRQLDADTLVERDTAEKELIALGPDITPLLPAMNQRLSAEVASRLQRVRTALDQAAIESRLSGTQISLSGKQPLKQALMKLEAAGGVRLNSSDIQDVELELQVNDITFWNALDMVLDACMLDVSLYGSRNSLDLFPNVREVSRSARTAYSGAFRAEPMMIELTRDLSLSGPGGMTLAVQLAWEPSAIPIFMNIPAQSLRALLDDGTELAAINPLANPEFTPVEGSMAMEVTLQFAAPPRDCEEIKEVSMDVVALLPGSLQSFRFDELEKKEEVKLKHGDLTIVLEPLRRSGEFAELQMSMLLHDPNGVFDSYRGWVLNKEAYILDPQGRRLENQGFHTNRLADNEVGVSYLFEIPENPQGYVFVYEIPGSVIKKTIPLQMKNIPLP